MNLVQLIRSKFLPSASGHVVHRCAVVDGKGAIKAIISQLDVVK